jgi:TetR/AcrR family transcriptional regulator
MFHNILTKFLKSEKVSAYLLLIGSKLLIKELEINEPITGRMSGDERRKQILRVAIKLFASEGFNGTTTKKIAAEAGVSEAMVFRHFATKGELYNAILDQKACEGGNPNPCEWASEALAAKDDEQFFYQIILHALSHHEQDPEYMRLLFHSALEGHELAEMFVEQNIVPLYEFMSAYISQRQRDGAIRDDINPRVIIRAFVGMMIHHSLNNSLWDKKRRILDISNEDAARAFVEIILSGIKK